MDSWQVQRVLVSLENQPKNKLVLEMTAELAHALNAELTGIYVLNDTLISLAALPFTRLIHAHGSGSSKLDVKQIQAQNRLSSNQAKQALELCANRWQVDWSFYTQNASAIEQQAVATQMADLICLQLPKQPRTVTSPDLLDLSAVIERHPGSLLITPESCNVGNELIAIIDNEQTLDKVLAPVLRLGMQGKYPVIIVLEEDQETALKLKAAAEERLLQYNLAAQFVLMNPLNFTTFCQLICKRSPHLIVISLDDPLLANDQIRQLVEAVKVPILIVR